MNQVDIIAALDAAGWITGPTYQIQRDGTRTWHRGKECLMLKFGHTNNRLTSAEYSRPRQPGETSDLPDDYNPRWGLPAIYSVRLPRKNITDAVLAVING